MGAKLNLTHPSGPPPAAAVDTPTPTEQWYLDCLREWCRQVGRAPSIGQLAAWIQRAKMPTWNALASLETKGLVTRAAKRRFIPAEFVGVLR